MLDFLTVTNLESDHLTYLKKVLWREMMEMMFVCLKTIMGRKQVGFDLPLRSQDGWM